MIIPKQGNELCLSVSATKMETCLTDEIVQNQIQGVLIYSSLCATILTSFRFLLNCNLAFCKILCMFDKAVAQTQTAALKCWIK